MSSDFPGFQGGDARAAAKPAPSNVVVFFRFSAEEVEVPPPGYSRIEDAVQKSESIAERRVLLEKARQQIGEDYYSEGKSPLAQLRLSKGLSQARLAKELGTTQSHIARMEAGADLMLSTVARLAEALCVDREELASALMSRQ